MSACVTIGSPENAEPIGWLKPSGSGYVVIGRCCIDKIGPHTLARVYRANVIPYSQRCCDCGKELVPGGSIRDLFDGT